MISYLARNVLGHERSLNTTEIIKSYNHLYPNLDGSRINFRSCHTEPLLYSRDKENNNRSPKPCLQSSYSMQVDDIVTLRKSREIRGYKMKIKQSFEQ